MKNMITASVLLLACMALSSCGKTQSSQNRIRTKADMESTTETAESSAAAAADTEFPAAAAKTQSIPADKFQDIIEDSRVLYFAVTGIEEDGEWGYTMHVSMQNRSDKNIMVSLGNVSVNGIMADPGWSDTVNAGMKAESDIIWPSETLSRQGISDVTQIEFNLIATDDDDPAAGYLTNVKRTVYPKGKERVKEAAYTKAEGDQTLFDDGNAAMIITGKHPDGEWGYTLDVCLINRTDRDQLFAAGEASVNGTMCDPCWAQSVAAGKMARCQIMWPTEELESAGIDKVTSIRLPIAVYDDENYEEVRAEESFDVKN